MNEGVVNEVWRRLGRGKGRGFRWRGEAGGREWWLRNWGSEVGRSVKYSSMACVSRP